MKVYRGSPPSVPKYLPVTEEILKLEIEVVGEMMEKAIREENYELCCVFRDCIKRARKKLSAWSKS